MTINLSDLPVEDELACCALFGPVPGKHGHAVQLSDNDQKTSFTFEKSGSFSRLLSDKNGSLWIAQWTEQLSDPAHIHIYDKKGAHLKTIEVEGRPNLYEYGHYVFVGCERDDGQSRIYQFSKQELKETNQWKVNGYVWGLLFSQSVLYVTCYLPSDNLAVLYLLGEQEEAAIELGENFFPTDLYKRDSHLFVSACPVMGREKSRIIELDETFNTTREIQVQTPPRSIYASDKDLVIYGKELVNGRKEKLIYCNLESGQRREYNIPPVYKIKEDEDRLYLLNQEEKAVLEWDSRKRKLTKKYLLPQCEDRPLLDFHCCR